MFDHACSDLDGPTSHACYRIVQEALNNSIHHGKANRIDISMTRDMHGSKLVIEDDGVGFELPDDLLILVRASHFGLVGIRERAEMQGGFCKIDSAPGKGTRIVVAFPVSDRLVPVTEANFM